MSRRKSGRIVSSRARKTVSAFLELIDKPDELLDEIGPIAIQFERLGFEAIPALSEALGHEDARARILAAWFIVRVATDRTDSVDDRGACVRSTSLLVESLKEGDAEQRLWPLVLLTLGGVPQEAVVVLREILDDPDERLRIFAAAALTWCGENAAEGLAVLGQALGHEDEILVATAAHAFARLGVRPEAVERIAWAFPRVQPDSQYHILQCLKQIGPPALGASDMLERFVEDRENHPALRGAAASALGSITRGTKRGLPALKKALRSADYRVVAGVIEGLAALDDFPDDAVRCLAALLSIQDDDEMRKAAANGLRMMRGRAAAAVPTLLERAFEERSVEVLRAMVEALAAIGAPALPPLVDLMKDDDIQKIAVASAALMQMGSDAAVALAKLLKSERDERVQMEVVRALREMGRAAAPAVPVLAEMLDEATDDEVAAYIVAAVAASGSAGAVATPALIRCLMNRGDEVAYWAERALWNVGPEAIPLLELELQAATGQAKRRIEGALAGMRSPDTKQFERFYGIEIKVLKTYLLVAQILAEHGATSWRKMELLLERQGVELGASTLIKHVSILSEALKIPLTDSNKNRKGGLTAEGRAIVSEIKKYMAAVEKSDLPAPKD